MEQPDSDVEQPVFARWAPERIRLRTPNAQDGYALNQLVAHSPPLDRNSLYCNILQCSHFADTAIVAEWKEQPALLAGSISGYCLPQQPDTYFLWQVVVAAEARGLGLAKAMMKALLEQLAAKRGVCWLATTITPDNEASWALFRGVARDLGVACKDEVWLQRDIHFKGEHDSEHLLRIGPFGPQQFQSAG